MDGTPMMMIMMQLRDIPISPPGVQGAMLLGMVVGLTLMSIYPKGRPNEVFTWMTALLSIGSLATLAISKQVVF
jgi:hypothetical protein